MTAVSCFCILVNHAPAEEPTTAEAPADTTTTDTSRPANEMIQLNFPQNVEIGVLVEYVSKRLGLNILYDESAVSKRITLASPTRIPKDSLMGLLQGVLRTAGLILVDADQPGWKKIVPAKDFLTVTGTFRRESNELTDTEAAEPITQIFPLNHITTTTAEQFLRPFISQPGGSVMPLKDQNIIIVSDYGDRLRQIASMLSMVDVPPEETAMQFVDVKHVDAQDLAKRVADLLRERQTIAGRDEKSALPFVLRAESRTSQIVIIAKSKIPQEAIDLIHMLDVPADTETKTYRFQYIDPIRMDRLAREFLGNAARDTYSSVVDSESGMLIVTGQKRIHTYIENLRHELDVVGADAVASYVRFYKLRNTTAGSVLATIAALDSGPMGLTSAAFDPTSPSKSTAGTPEKFAGPNNPPAPAGQEPPLPPVYTDNVDEKTTKQLESSPSVTAVRTRDATVTVDANTNTIIVVAPPEVQRVYQQLVEKLDKRRPQVMVEVTLVTLDTSDNFSLGIELSRLGHFGTNNKNEYLVFSSFGLSTPDITTGDLLLDPGRGLNATLIAPDILDGVLKALATTGRAEVVSAPKVLVNDNATATLSSVSESPFTSVNASSTVSTTSFGGYASAGTTVTATPHISEGDHLQLEYSVTLSSFSGEGSDGVPPPRQTNTINSEVTIPDGNAIIVGGLTRKDHSKTVSKIPFLGDLPAMEYIFGSRTKNKSQSTLFAFIRPVILRDDRFEDLKYLSELDLNRAGQPGNLPASKCMIMN